MAFFPLRRSSPDSFQQIPGLPAALLVGIVLLAAGCHPAVTDPKDPKFIVVEKGNWHITRAQVDEKMAAFLKQKQMSPAQAGPDNMMKLETWTIKNLVLEKLLLDKAATMQLPDVEKDEAADLERIKGAASDAEFAQQLKSIGLTLDDVKKQIHEKVVIGKVLDKEAYKNIDPTEQEINDFYLKNKDSINTPAEVRVSRILIHMDDKTSAADKAVKKKAIDKARDRVMRGEEFSKVAMEVSEDRSSAPKGGDLGFFQKDVSEPGFDEIAFNTKKDAVSPVFKTPLGYEFLKVTDFHPAGEVSLADIRPKIEAYLRDNKKGEQEEAYTADLLAKSGVTYNVPLVDLSAPPSPAAKATAPDTSAPADTNADQPVPAPAPDASATNAPAQH